MADRLFLYIDILGFSDMVKSGKSVDYIYEIANELNAQKDSDFTCIVFSDTIVVYAHDVWGGLSSQCIMWLTEFAKELFYHLSHRDTHFRGYITYGDFVHYNLSNLSAYYGRALIECYESEKAIKSTGVFIDNRLLPLCDIFHTSPYNEKSSYVHVMQDLESGVSFSYDQYPMSGYYLMATGMEWWMAYLFVYLRTIHRHMSDDKLPNDVRKKYQSAWDLIGHRHGGLLQRLAEADFEFGRVIEMDWTEPLARIGTEGGAWG